MLSLSLSLARWLAGSEQCRAAYQFRSSQEIDDEEQCLKIPDPLPACQQRRVAPPETADGDTGSAARRCTNRCTSPSWPSVLGRLGAHGRSLRSSSCSMQHHRRCRAPIACTVRWARARQSISPQPIRARRHLCRPLLLACTPCIQVPYGGAVSIPALASVQTANGQRQAAGLHRILPARGQRGTSGPPSVLCWLLSMLSRLGSPQGSRRHQGTNAAGPQPGPRGVQVPQGVPCSPANRAIVLAGLAGRRLAPPRAISLDPLLPQLCPWAHRGTGRETG